MSVVKFSVVFMVGLGFLFATTRYLYRKDAVKLATGKCFLTVTTVVLGVFGGIGYMAAEDGDTTLIDLYPVSLAVVLAVCAIALLLGKRNIAKQAGHAVQHTVQQEAERKEEEPSAAQADMQPADEKKAPSELKLLPLGTVFTPKKPIKGQEEMRMMITGWYAKSSDGSMCHDYIVTPWPLGFVEFNEGLKKEKERFFSCNEDAIGEIEFLGGVDDELKARSEWLHAKATALEGFTAPLAIGTPSIVRELGDVPDTVKARIDIDVNERLPLGSIVTTVFDHGKFMVYGHAGKADGMVYDYLVTGWPEGANPDVERVTANVILREDITSINFIGYENALSKALFRRLDSVRRF